MSTIAKFTLEEYQHMVELGVFESPKPRRIELIHGELRDMTPAGPTHNDVIRDLNEWTFDNLSKKQVKVSIQSSLGLGESESAPEPDFAWLKPKKYRDEHPTGDDVFLVIEVADSSLSFDRGEKATLYAEAGIRDYWIVNVRDWCIEVHRDPKDGTYQSVIRHDVHDTISPLAFPDVSLSVGKLFDA